jgi:hypothetical protein
MSSKKAKRTTPVEPATPKIVDVDADSLEAGRQRARDRAGDDPPKGTGGPRK